MAKQEKKGTKSTTGKVRKKQQKSVPAGVVHVKATFNNTIVTIADLLGNVVSWASAGKSGFSGSRKSSGFAATVAAQKASKDAMTHGMREVEINISGSGAGRESAVKGVQSAGLTVTMIRDVTPVPHNGCRARKKRRV